MDHASSAKTISLVLKGQILERPALIASGDHWLDGLYHKGEQAPSLLLCPPAPGDGGIDAPPIAEMAHAAARSGHASLRFSHRGTGASTGVADPPAMIEDGLAALQHLMESATPRVVVAGYLSGCTTALGVAKASRRVKQAILVAPIAPPPPQEELAALRLLVLLPESGGSKPLDPWREAVKAHDGRTELIASADERFLRGLSLLAERVVAFLAGDA